MDFKFVANERKNKEQPRGRYTYDDLNAKGKQGKFLKIVLKMKGVLSAKMFVAIEVPTVSKWYTSHVSLCCPCVSSSAVASGIQVNRRQGVRMD